MNVVQISIAAMPFLLSLASRSGKAIAPCLLAGIFTVLFGNEPPRAAMAWCVGLLIAAVAVRERLARTEPSSRPSRFQRKGAAGRPPSRPISCSLVQG
jgi:hypothetical protein